MATETFLTAYSFKLNVAECEFIVFERSRIKSDLRLSVGGSQIRNVQVVTYVGLWFQSDGRWSKHKEITKGRAILSSNKGSVIYEKGFDKNVEFAVQLLDTFVTSVMNFGCHIWTSSDLNSFDSIRGNFLKRVLKLPKSTITLSVLGELGKCCFICNSVYLMLCFYARMLCESRLKHVKDVCVSDMSIRD